jgi:hypothetical protein
VLGVVTGGYRDFAGLGSKRAEQQSSSAVAVLKVLLQETSGRIERGRKEVVVGK